MPRAEHLAESIARCPAGQGADAQRATKTTPTRKWPTLTLLLASLLGLPALTARAQDAPPPGAPPARPGCGATHGGTAGTSAAGDAAFSGRSGPEAADELRDHGGHAA